MNNLYRVRCLLYRSYYLIRRQFYYQRRLGHFFPRCPSSFWEPGWHHRGPSQQCCFYFSYIQVVLKFTFIYLIRGMTVLCMRRVSLTCLPLILLSTCSSRKGSQTCGYSIPRTFFPNWRDSQPKQTSPSCCAYKD